MNPNSILIDFQNKLRSLTMVYNNLDTKINTTSKLFDEKVKDFESKFSIDEIHSKIDEIRKDLEGFKSNYSSEDFKNKIDELSKEIEIMREAGKIVAETHELLKSAIIPGVSTLELDTIAEENIRKYNAVPSFKGYGGFKGSICASINNEVVQGAISEAVQEELYKCLLSGQLASMTIEDGTIARSKVDEDFEAI